MDWAETILAGVCVVCMTLLGVDLYKSAREKLKTMRKRDKYVWAAIFNLTGRGMDCRAGTAGWDQN